MRRTPISRVVVLLVALSLSGLVAPAQAAAPLRSLTGVVTSAVDGATIAGIEVCAVRSDGARWCGTSTTEGTYTLRAPEGRHRLEARDPYLYGSWVDQGAPGRLVTVARSGSRADVAMRPGADITLHLTSDTGPISEYSAIRAYRVLSGGRIATNPYGFSNVTVDSSGRRAFAHVAKLPPGGYVLKLDTGDPEAPHAQTWHPAAAAARDAQVVTVAEGEQRRVADMPLQAPGSLRVTATGPKGRSVTIHEARLFDEGGREVPPTSTRSLSPGRTLVYEWLPPGRYRVRVEENTKSYHYVQWHGEGKDLAGARQITVTAGQQAKAATRLRWPTPRVIRGVRTKHEGFVVSVTQRPGWSPRLHYRWDDVHWYRDGRRTDAVGYHYSMERRDVGHRIQACFLAVRTGWGRVRTCSPAYRPKVTHVDP